MPEISYSINDLNLSKSITILWHRFSSVSFTFLKKGSKANYKDSVKGKLTTSWSKLVITFISEMRSVLSFCKVSGFAWDALQRWVIPRLIDIKLLTCWCWTSALPLEICYTLLSFLLYFHANWSACW